MPNIIPFCGNCKFNLRQKEESSRDGGYYEVGRCVRNHARSDAPKVWGGDFCGEFVPDIEAAYTSLEYRYGSEYDFNRIISPNIKLARHIGTEEVAHWEVYFCQRIASPQGTEDFDKKINEAEKEHRIRERRDD
jgi:hypothetical protein